MDRKEEIITHQVVNRHGKLAYRPEKLDAVLRLPALEDKQNTPACFRHWADEAVKKLRFPPDRKRVRAELYDHFLDRREDLLFRGLVEEEANKQTLEMMGSPSETAGLLAKVHKPWLGWLLRLTRLAMICVIALVLFNYGEMLFSRAFSTVSPEYLLEDSYFEHWEGQTGCDVIARRRATSRDHVTFGPFEVALEDGGIYYIRENTEKDGISKTYTTYWCRLLLSFSAAPWHTMTSDMVDRNLHIVTDQGINYTLLLSPYEAWNPKYNFDASFPGRLSLNARACLISLQEIPMDTEWVELWFTQSGEENRIRINLSEWAYDPDFALESITDETKAVETLTNKLVGLGTWGINDPVAQPQRALAVTGTVTEDGFSIPWAWKINYLDSRAKGEESEPQPFVDCILVFPGTVCEPLLWEDLTARIRVTNADPNSETPGVIYWSGGRDLYQNAILWRIRWQYEDGALSYVITDTGGRHGVPATLTLELGEEAAP